MLFFHKKECAKLREQHYKMKKQVDQIRAAERQDEQAQMLQKGTVKPNTAATGQRAHKTLNIKNKSSIKNQK